MNTAGSLFSQQIGLSTWKNYDMVIRRLICKRDEEFRWIFPDDIFEGGGAVDPPIFACKFAHVKDCSRATMPYTCPKNLDGFIPYLPNTDIKFRQQVGADLLAYLHAQNSAVCQNIGEFVNGLMCWTRSSNHKVSSNGIEAMTLLIDRPGHDFRPYLGMILSEAMDRLGNANGIIRKNAQLLILKLLERKVLNPQTLLDKLTPGFTHKNANMREEVLRCLVNTVNKHGAQSVHVSQVMPDICGLLSNPIKTVRDTAFSTIADLYKHVGEKLLKDIERRKLVDERYLPALLKKFEEVRSAGELLSTASTAMDAPSTSNHSEDSLDSNDEVDKNHECHVCTEKCHGTHYGAIACRACEKFFKRTVEGDLAYNCISNNECIINVSTRKNCPACRLTKCQLAGMKSCRVGADKYKKSLGVTVSDVCKTTYEEIMKDKKHRYVIFFINDEKQIDVEVIGARNEKYVQFLVDLQAGGADECRYGLYDFEYTHQYQGTSTSFQKPKLFLMFWYPNTAKFNYKRLYYSSFEALKKSLVDVQDITVTDLSEASQEAVEEKLRATDRQ